MSDFIVSARKYRPKTFDTVVGQSSITLTLKNAIRENQLAQSFLFCGPRGVGKTSCARILAKTINCENISNKIEACDNCVSCKSFHEHNSFNIHELDAASNNSVDDIRKLVDQVRFAPQVGDYNIYIIDEVHMLSSQAFNAFLKTLEEPPRHAKFILATTEKHKIIPTILSRCQIFDFKRVGVHDISSHLAFVAQNEGIDAEQKALDLIAQKSDGAMRDALSLFDRLVSFSKSKLTYQLVIEHLNILDYDYYFKITDALLHNDITKLLNIFNEILENGFDGNHFINGLAGHIRDLLVSKDQITIQLLEAGDELKEKYIKQSNLCDVVFLIKALEFCNECDVQYKSSNNKRLLVELCLMRVSSIGHDYLEKKKNKRFVVTKENIESLEIIKDNDSEAEISENMKDTSIANIRLEEQVRKSKTISISETFKDIDKEVENARKNGAEMRSESFDKKEIEDSWKDMIKMFNKKGKSNLVIILGSHLPKLLENYEIELLLSNRSQQEIFEDEKEIVLNFLRAELSNDYININTKIEEITKKDIAYTNTDKFKKMLTQNQYVDKLRVRLALDPDY